jgi:hypothetical protein
MPIFKRKCHHIKHTFVKVVSEAFVARSLDGSIARMFEPSKREAAMETRHLTDPLADGYVGSQLSRDDLEALLSCMDDEDLTTRARYLECCQPIVWP